MYRYELHMHTREGSACGHWDAEEMIRAYKVKGYSGAVITDHFIGGNIRVDRNLPWEELVESYTAGYRKSLTLARELDFDLFFGVEEAYGIGKEFLVYGIEPEFLRERPFLRGAELAVWNREVHAVGGVLIYAHPFRNRPYIVDPRVMPDMSLADGVEIFNSCNLPEDNVDAARVFGDADCIKIAGSDNHGVNMDRLSAVVFPHRVRTSAQLVQALRARTFTLETC